MSGGRTYKKGTDRLSKVKRYNFSSIREKEDIYYLKMKQIRNIAKKREEEINFFDTRYDTIVNVFMKEVAKRGINIYASDFDEKLEGFLQTLVKGKFYIARFKNDDIRDVKNAILRRVNEERRKKEASREK